ncbi:MAG: hypothetical protein ACT4O2_13730 [Beijerinckiaceae bacterium]
MSVQVQLRRDTLANVLANKGVAGELFVSTDTKELFVQDGTTNGGFRVGIVAARDALNVPHGGSISYGCQEELLTGLSGATKVSTIQIPVGAIVLGVSVRVTTLITGAGGFRVDPTTDFGAGGAYMPNGKFGFVAAALNTTNPGIIGPAAAYFASTITLTGRNAGNTANVNFTAGNVRIQINYMLVNPPAS